MRFLSCTVLALSAIAVAQNHVPREACSVLVKTFLVPAPCPTTSSQPSITSAEPNEPYITITEPYTGTGVITEPITTTVPPTGTDPGKVIVLTPVVTPVESTSSTDSSDSSTVPDPTASDEYITTTEPYTGTGSITEPITTTVPPEGTNPGKVIIMTPVEASTTSDVPVTADDYITTTEPYTGTGSITEPITTTVSPDGTNPGKVVVVTPVEEPVMSDTPVTSDDYITTTEPYTGTGSITGPITTTVPPEGTNPGKVIVLTPVENPVTSKIPVTSDDYITTTEPYTGTGSITEPITTTVPPDGINPGKVIIMTPVEASTTSDDPYITTTEPYTGTGSITAPVTTTVPPEGTNPGKVIIMTPVEASTTTSDEPSTTLDEPFITTTEPYTGTGSITAPITTTIPPDGINPGKVVILTPIEASTTSEESYVTTTEPYTGTGSITDPITTTLPPEGTNPSRVIIMTPVDASTTSEDSYITTTEPYTGTGRITEPVTTTVPPEGTNPGKVIIMTPVVTESIETSETSATPTTTESIIEEITSTTAESTTSSAPSSTESSLEITSSPESSTSTTSTTSSTSSTSSAEPSCTGLAWAYYQLDHGNDAGHIPWHTRYGEAAMSRKWSFEMLNLTVALADQKPTRFGNSKRLGWGGNCGKPPLYDGKPTDERGFFIMQHLGYFKPKTTGTYRFNVPYADDMAMVWLGDKAVNGWNSGNADAKNWITPSGPGREPFAYTVTSTDTLIPIRVLMAQAMWCSSYSLTVTDPSNKLILGLADASFDGQFVSRCNGTAFNEPPAIEPPVIVSQFPPVPAAGSAQPGLTWEYYTLAEGNGNGNVSAFAVEDDSNPTATGAQSWAEKRINVRRALSRRSPTLTGTSPLIYHPVTAGDQLRLYGKTYPNINSRFMALQHLGYFVPDKAGTYTFSLSAYDAAYLWLGDKAKDAFENANADLISWRGATARKFTLDAQAGDAIPMRLLLLHSWSTVAPNFWLSLEVRDPSGTVILSNTKQAGQQFVTVG